MFTTPSIKEIFQKATDSKASDIHFLAGQPPIFRIDGVLCRSAFPVLSANKIADLASEILTDKQKKEIAEKKELDLSMELNESVRFRTNLYWEKGNMALAARVIWPHLPTMEEIDMPTIAYDLAKLNQGLIIVTGPTGCGKSTTLAAMLNYINQIRSCNIITLEDPIEFIFTTNKSLISQRELGRDMLSFGDALKHVVRQDPNIIMVGEMRDLETIALVLTLAETGHLILTTLHTPSAPQTIDRIIDVFPPHQQNQIRLQLALSLRAIIGQHLLPKKSGGRIAVREIMMNTPVVATLIRENKTAQIKSVLQTGSREGMITIEQALNKLVQQDTIDYETALAHTNYPELIAKRQK